MFLEHYIKILFILLTDLGKDGCMSEFTWNSGGHYGKPWGEHLPTDAAVSHSVLLSS